MGMKTNTARTNECVGPRWKASPARMSMSGIMDKTRTNGILMFAFRVWAEPFARRYASAICPTPNINASPGKLEVEVWPVSY